jgi:hypothetical protein
MNGDDSGDDNPLKGFYAYKNTFDEDTVWMAIPRHGMSIAPLRTHLAYQCSSHVHQHNQPVP